MRLSEQSANCSSKNTSKERERERERGKEKSEWVKGSCFSLFYFVRDREKKNREILLRKRDRKRERVGKSNPSNLLGCSSGWGWIVSQAPLIWAKWGRSLTPNKEILSQFYEIIVNLIIVLFTSPFKIKESINSHK